MVRFDALPVGFRSGAVVVGCCALWGRTVEHSAGFRGQHAYPLVLVVTSGLGLESTPRMRRLRRQLRLPTLEGALIQPQNADGVEALSRDLGRLYGVPVHPVANLPDTWSCGWARASDPEADAVRAEAVDGLAARRLGDRAAHDRLTRCLQDMLDSGG
ncbi:MAG TPA: hypothetical protein VGH76_04655 [Actinomycetospora sp.]|jgi:hypothetical protein|uniref:hypothetical protein n=1 Tax=Actinomycetospora sp. TaxID=1872135 RepID=UPI002F405FC2